MKFLLVAIIFLVPPFASSLEVQNQKKEAHVLILIGSSSEHRIRYEKLTAKKLDTSEVSLIFMRSEGYVEKEIRFKHKEIERIPSVDEFAFDQRVVDRTALISKMKNSAVVIENTFETWSDDRRSWLGKNYPNKELPEGPNSVHVNLKFYDGFGSVLMEKNNDGCNVNINSDYCYSRQSFGFQDTFAISDNGERFVFCEFCENHGGCFVYSPVLKKSFQLDTVPIFQDLFSFSPSARYFAFYNSSIPKGVTFYDLEAKISAEIAVSSAPLIIRVSDDGKLMIQESSTREKTYYDIQGNKIKTNQ